MNSNTLSTASVLEQPIKVTSSPHHAFKNWFNIFILCCMILTGVGSLVMYLFDFKIFFLLLGFFTIIILIPIDIWHILTRSLEISQDGVRYSEAWKTEFFKWDEIQALSINEFWEEILIWTGGKKARIRVAGLPIDKLVSAKGTLMAEAKARQIMVK